MNHLEQLVAEWYEFNGYFVRRNIHTNKLLHGGYGNEIDVIAFKAKSKELVHIEVSGDADAWSTRRERFRKKFSLSRDEYEKIIDAEFGNLKKVAIVGWSRTSLTPANWTEDFEVQSIPSFLDQIAQKIKPMDFMQSGVPENFPVLRTIQLMFYSKFLA